MAGSVAKMASAVLLFGAVCLSGMPRADAAPGDAGTLVNLVRPHERQAQAVRFMVAVSPFGNQAGLAECTVQRMEAPLKGYLESLYAAQMSPDELRQAVLFFESPAGREAVRLKLKHELGIFAAAEKGEMVEDERVKYPAEVARALESFRKTPAGRFFPEEPLESREPFSGHVSELRSEALAQCLKEKK